MAEQIDKASILDQMRTKYAMLEEILTPLDNVQMTTAGVNGDWSIKDVLAHMTAWHYRLLNILHAAGRNEEPAISGPASDEEVDRLNEHFYQENKLRSLDEVLNDFRSSYLQIVEEVHALNEEDLLDPQRFAWMGGVPLWRVLAGDTYDHYEEHSPSIQAWLAKSRQN